MGQQRSPLKSLIALMALFVHKKKKFKYAGEKKKRVNKVKNREVPFKRVSLKPYVD